MKEREGKFFLSALTRERDDVRADESDGEAEDGGEDVHPGRLRRSSKSKIRSGFRRSGSRPRTVATEGRETARSQRYLLQDETEHTGNRGA